MKAPQCQTIAFPVTPFHFATGRASKPQQKAAVGEYEKPQSVPWYIRWHQSSFARLSFIDLICQK